MDFSIAISPCPNDTYLMYGFLAGLIGEAKEKSPTIALMDIQQLNRCMLEEKFPVIKASYAALFNPQCAYRPLRVGGALGRGVGPLLVCEKTSPLTQDFLNEGISANLEHVVLPGEQTTATTLLRWAYGGGEPFKHERHVRFDLIAAEVLKIPHAAGVLIHEGRFTYEKQGLYLLADLGVCWELQTKLPLPLGGLCVHNDLSDHEVEEISGAIKESLSCASSAPAQEVDRIMAEHAQEMDPSIMRRHVDLYVNSFSEDLGEEGERALQVFAELLGPKDCAQNFLPRG